MKYFLLITFIFISNGFCTEDGYTTLFNAKDLSGWIKDEHAKDYGWKVEDGCLVSASKYNLYTEKEYMDYSIKFAFLLAPAANNGLGLRVPLSGDPRLGGRRAFDVCYNSFEVQILDDSSPKYQRLQAYQFHGAVYGVVPAQKGHLKAVGEWNEQEVIYKNSQLKIILNGVEILNEDIADFSDTHGKARGRAFAKGHFCFAAHGRGIKIKDVRIKELKNDYALPTDISAATKGFTKLELSKGQSIKDYKNFEMYAAYKGKGRGSVSIRNTPQFEIEAKNKSQLLYIRCIDERYTVFQNGALIHNGVLLKGKARTGKISLPLAFKWQSLFIKKLGKQ